MPRVKVWYVAPSYRMANQIVWDELKQAVPKSWIRKINETKMQIKLMNGSVLECKGADDPDSLRGVGLNYVILDEYQDMKPDVWTKVLRPTLAKDRGGAMFIGTPKGFANLYDIWEKGQSTNGTWKSWQFKTEESPFIPNAEIAEARRDLDPKTFRQEFEASFETMSGRVYSEFDRNLHVKDFVKFDPNLPIWVGMDFNVDPMTSVLMQYHKDKNHLHVIDEVFINDSSVLEMAEEIERRYWQHVGNMLMFPDPAGDSRQHARGESSLDILREKGMKRILFRRKHPPVRDRTNAVNKMLMNAQGDVSMYIAPKCREVIKSLEQTMYKPGTSDINKAMGAEHITDALGYPIEFKFPLKKIIIAGTSI